MDHHQRLTSIVHGECIRLFYFELLHGRRPALVLSDAFLQGSSRLTTVPPSAVLALWRLTRSLDDSFDAAAAPLSERN